MVWGSLTLSKTRMDWREEGERPDLTFLWRSKRSVLSSADGDTDVAATTQEIRPTQMKANNYREHQEDQGALYSL